MELDDQLNQPEIWNNPDYALRINETSRQPSSQIVEPGRLWTVQVGDMVELMVR